MSRLTPQDFEHIRNLALIRGGECLHKGDDAPRTVGLRFRCKKGHVWAAAIDRILAGAWCPKCPSSNKRLTIEEMHAIAGARSGRCLSRVYVNADTRLVWECKRGHVWRATPSDIKSGHWCYRCAMLERRLPMEEIQALAKSRGGECLSKECPRVLTRLKWKCARGHIWMATLHLVKYANMWCHECEREDRLEEFRRLAVSRGGKCLSTKYVRSNIKLHWQCEKGHTWWACPPAVCAGTWCPTCGVERTAQKLKLSIKVAKDIAKSRGGKCLSREYVNIVTPLRWRCKVGHTWSARLNDVRTNKSWCPKCAVKLRSEARKLSIGVAQAVAQKRGGRCLSKIYVNTHAKLKWKCAKGHTWSASLGSVKNLESWCPTCAHKKRSASHKE